MQSASSWAPKVVRKCESKHWFSCGVDGRSVGLSVYSHVITKFFGMGRFTKLWGSATKPSNKLYILTEPSANNGLNYSAKRNEIYGRERKKCLLSLTHFKTLFKMCLEVIVNE